VGGYLRGRLSPYVAGTTTAGAGPEVARSATMFDPMFVQAEVDYRRERATRVRSSRRRRPEDRVRIPFVGDRSTVGRRVR